MMLSGPMVLQVGRSIGHEETKSPIEVFIKLIKIEETVYVILQEFITIFRGSYILIHMM